MKALALGVASAIAAGLAQAGPPARIASGRMEQRTAEGGLPAAVQALLREGPAPTWIGYAVETNDGGSACCWTIDDARGGCGGCRLEGARSDRPFRAEPSPAVALEGPRRARILLRAQGGRIGQVRAFSEDCALDVGGLAMIWLEGVRPVESADFLGSLVGADRYGHPESPDPGRSVADGALLALSMHAEPRAVDVMLKAARRPSPSRVRKQALFWLAQAASRRAAPAIAAAVDDDPEIEVKKHAVFALSQLPPAEGVTHLIRVARTHAHREVRKQAIFWLGQSEDARALAFFEETLGR